MKEGSRKDYSIFNHILFKSIIHINLSIKNRRTHAVRRFIHLRRGLVKSKD